MINSSKVLPVGTVLRSGSRAYTIVEVLGQGGFGITYRATAMVSVDNIRIEGQFAIKEHFIERYCGRNGATNAVDYSEPVANEVENSRKDFLSEARRLRNLSTGENHHPNIVCVNETFEANNTAYFVMEYLKGESLSSYVKRRGPLSDNEMRSVMEPIIDAVAFLHSEYITHLDIKPANIMLTRNDDGKLRPVLIDFGLSRHFDPNTGEPSSSIQQAGFSEGYAPIEQVQAFRQFFPGTDVYSLGATMLYALTGQTPIAAENLDDETLRRTIPAGLPASTVVAITEAMHHFRKHRPENAGALLALLTNRDYTIKVDNDPIIPDIYEPTLQSVTPSKPKPRPTPTPQPSPAPKPKRKNGLYIGIGVVLLLAILCAAWFINEYKFNERQEEQKKVAMTEEPMPMATPVDDETAPAPEPASETPAPVEESEPESPAPAVEEPAVRPHKTPHHLDLAVRYNGERGYFSSDEWTSLSSADKSKYRKIGMVVSAKGQRFIVELHDKEGGHAMVWYEAMEKYSTVMPTFAQGEALTSIRWKTWESKMDAYGGDATRWFWTNEDKNSSYAWVVSMSNGYVNYNTKSYTYRVRAVAPVI